MKFNASDQLIECVPNFSEGKNKHTIDAIANAIQAIPSIKLLNVDIGIDANRTVFTYVGKPKAILEATYNAIVVAQDKIDMQQHHGAHPRMGACDVCPFVPLQNICMQEVISLTEQLGEQIGALGIPVYLYEQSAKINERKNLSFIRKGEYEAIPEKMKSEKWKPDFGPFSFNKKFGMIALGARNFLVAYNINLNTKDVNIAQAIAKQIRSIREKKDNSYLSNLFQSVKAIGWYMDEFSCAQVSTNIIDIENSKVSEVFDAISELAKEFDVRTNGSELIGLIPKAALAHPTLSIDEVIQHIGLNAVKPFDKEKNIIEYNLFK
ncbi:MAG: glutamate formimidoyltransferase [Chitinophagales bacterium]